MLHAVGVPLDELGLSRAGSGSHGIRPVDLAPALRELGRLPRHPGAVLVRVRVQRGVRADRAAVGRQRRRPVRPARRDPGAAGVPAAGAVRTVPHRRARDHRRPGRRPRRPPARCATTPRSPAACSRRSAPTATCTPTSRPGAAGSTPLGERAPASTRPPTPGSSTPCAAAARPSSPRAAPRPTPGVIDAGSEPLADAEASRIHRAALDGTAHRGRGRRLPAQHALPARRDGERRRPRDAAAPRRDPQPPPADLRRVRAGHRSRPSGRRRVHRTADADPARLRHEPDVPARALHGRRDDLLAGDRAARRLLSVGLRGAPWWFLDTPAAILRYRQAITDSAGFTKTSGFIDDTRAFCSIPARHDMSRRVDASFLSSLVVSHQLTEEDAFTIAGRLVSDIPRATFRLG